MKAIAALLFLLLGGCAHMSSMFSSCEQQNTRFSDVSACTKAAIRTDSRYGWHSGYTANANRAISALDMLDEKVSAGSVTEREARYRMHEIMSTMQAQAMAAVNALDDGDTVGQRRTVRSVCTPNGGQLNCVSR